ncbi:Protein of unknown function [Salinibacillus kushneri]|uniref:DUF2642 domain-containing protein n=1 Tax=Salinibacillus kushneri TaxID=237682 RepID=A0A1I0AH74_9BACI|nr:DUF2642 domain-containing protein [Salinibacillus kushneri]SES93035.1 Protein of unknown function [Salinibacillus kushneri]
MALTDRQRTLLRMFNQMMLQNLPVNNTNGTTENNLSDLVDFNFDLDVSLGGNDGANGDDDAGADTPATIRDVLVDLTNESVEVTTTFGPVSGTLIAVEDDYIALIDSAGDTVLVPINQIEYVSEL